MKTSEYKCEVTSGYIYDVEFEDGRISYDYCGNDYSDLEKDLQVVPFDHPTVTLMRYWSQSLVRKVLLQSDFSPNLYVDNDFGLIVPLKEFISLGMPLDREDMEEAGLPVILE